MNCVLQSVKPQHMEAFIIVTSITFNHIGKNPREQVMFWMAIKVRKFNPQISQIARITLRWMSLQYVIKLGDVREQLRNNQMRWFRKGLK